MQWNPRFSSKIWNQAGTFGALLGTYPLCVPHFLFVGNMLQPPRPSLSSRGQIQTVANQGSEGMQKQTRSSQETMYAQLLNQVGLFVTPGTVTHQAQLCPWDFPGKNTGVGCHLLFHGIFLTQGRNPCLLHWQAYSWPLSHLGSPRIHTGNQKRVKSTLGLQ